MINMILLSVSYKNIWVNPISYVQLHSILCLWKTIKCNILTKASKTSILSTISLKRVNVIQKYENNNETTIITQVMCTKCLCKYFLCVLESAKLTINDNPPNIMHLRHFFCWSFWSLLTLAYCYRINIFSCQLFVS